MLVSHSLSCCEFSLTSCTNSGSSRPKGPANGGDDGDVNGNGDDTRCFACAFPPVVPRSADVVVVVVVAAAVTADAVLAIGDEAAPAGDCDADDDDVVDAAPAPAVAVDDPPPEEDDVDVAAEPAPVDD